MLLNIGVQGAGQGCAKPFLVGATVTLRNIVGEERTVLLVSGVPLHRRLDLEFRRRLLCVAVAVAVTVVAARHLHRLGAFHVKHLRVDGLTGLVQPVHEFTNATLGMKGPLPSAFAFIREVNNDSTVQKCQFAQPACQRPDIEIQRAAKNLRIRTKTDLRPAAIARTYIAKRSVRDTGSVVLAILPPVPVHDQLQFLGQEVDDRNAYAMQPAGHLVRALVEFCACMQRGHDQFGRRAAGLDVRVNRDASPIVADSCPAIGQQINLDFCAEPGQRLVNRVVHHLVNQVMQTRSIIRVSDVHSRQLADRLAVLKHFDLVRSIGFRPFASRLRPGHGAFFARMLHKARSSRSRR